MTALKTLRILLLFALFTLVVSSCRKEGYLSLNQFTYIEVDSTRGLWGDLCEEPEWLRFFGLAMHDMDLDGYKEIVSGRYIYRNPGGDMSAEWERFESAINMDGMIVMDVDGDKHTDLIAEDLPDVYWVEIPDYDPLSWEYTRVCTIPPTAHRNGQGYRLAQIIPGGKPEILLSGDGGVYCIEVPANPQANEWPVTRIAESGSEEDIGVGDIDGDKLIDVVIGDIPPGEEHPTLVKWFANPGDGTGDWESTLLGETRNAVDRVGVADMDGDGMLDVVITEELWPGEEPDASLYWFRQPENPFSENWERTVLVTQYSMNNLDVGDVDRDGDYDIITSEHKGEAYKLQIFQNDGVGNFTIHLVDTGKESHLGTQLKDMDNDGDLDIVSIAWDHHSYLHLWRNDAIVKKDD